MKSPSSDFFENGGSYLLSNQQYETYVVGHDYIGRPDGQFMAPSNQMDDLLQNHPNNPREWERQLGLGENSLGDSNIRRVDLYNPQDYNPRLPSSDLSGSNDKFISGGKTAGGLDECVIDSFPNPESNPSVGKITNLDNCISKESVNRPIDAKTHSYSNKVADGGGARAPNTTKRGNTNNPTENKKASTKRGHKPSESESELHGNNSPLRGERPQEDSQNVPGDIQTQRGAVPGFEGAEDSQALKQLSDQHSSSQTGSNPKAVDEASKDILDTPTQTIGTKPQGMGM